VPKTQGQVWDLAVIDQQLFCGHNNGTLLIEKNQAQLISDITGGWTIKKLKVTPIGWFKELIRDYAFTKNKQMAHGYLTTHSKILEARLRR
jgi:hypothetical protein